jgi:hypothetical protein
MKHKNYETPITEVVWLQQQTQLLAGSEVSATIGDFQEEEWTPNPTSRTTGFPDEFNNPLGF